MSHPDDQLDAISYAMSVYLGNNSGELKVFADAFYHTYPSWMMFWYYHKPNTLLRNKCYICNGKGEWYRGDGTPVLIDDVPKEYRARLLIMI